MLDHTSTPLDVAAYRTAEPSARALVVKMGREALERQEQERQEARKIETRFLEMWRRYHAPKAPFIAPLVLLAVIIAGAALKLA